MSLIDSWLDNYPRFEPSLGLKVVIIVSMVISLPQVLQMIQRQKILATENKQVNLVGLVALCLFLSSACEIIASFYTTTVTSSVLVQMLSQCVFYLLIQLYDTNSNRYRLMALRGDSSWAMFIFKTVLFFLGIVFTWAQAYTVAPFFTDTNTGRYVNINDLLVKVHVATRIFSNLLYGIEFGAVGYASCINSRGNTHSRGSGFPSWGAITYIAKYNYGGSIESKTKLVMKGFAHIVASSVGASLLLTLDDLVFACALYKLIVFLSVALLVYEGSQQELKALKEDLKEVTIRSVRRIPVEASVRRMERLESVRRADRMESVRRIAGENAGPPIGGSPPPVLRDNALLRRVDNNEIEASFRSPRKSVRIGLEPRNSDTKFSPQASNASMTSSASPRRSTARGASGVGLLAMAGPPSPPPSNQGSSIGFMGRRSGLNRIDSYSNLSGSDKARALSGATPRADAPPQSARPLPSPSPRKSALAPIDSTGSPRSPRSRPSRPSDAAPSSPVWNVTNGDNFGTARGLNSAPPSSPPSPRKTTFGSAIGSSFGSFGFAVKRTSIGDVKPLGFKIPMLDFSTPARKYSDIGAEDTEAKAADEVVKPYELDPRRSSGASQPNSNTHREGHQGLTPKWSGLQYLLGTTPAKVIPDAAAAEDADFEPSTVRPHNVLDDIDEDEGPKTFRPLFGDSGEEPGPQVTAALRSNSGNAKSRRRSVAQVLLGGLSVLRESSYRYKEKSQSSNSKESTIKRVKEAASRESTFRRPRGEASRDSTMRRQSNAQLPQQKQSIIGTYSNTSSSKSSRRPAEYHNKLKRDNSRNIEKMRAEVVAAFGDAEIGDACDDFNHSSAALSRQSSHYSLPHVVVVSQANSAVNSGKDGRAGAGAGGGSFASNGASREGSRKQSSKKQRYWFAPSTSMTGLSGADAVDGSSGRAMGFRRIESREFKDRPALKGFSSATSLESVRERAKSISDNIPLPSRSSDCGTPGGSRTPPPKSTAVAEMLMGSPMSLRPSVLDDLIHVFEGEGYEGDKSEVLDFDSPVEGSHRKGAHKQGASAGHLSPGYHSAGAAGAEGASGMDLGRISADIVVDDMESGTCSNEGRNRKTGSTGPGAGAGTGAGTGAGLKPGLRVAFSAGLGVDNASAAANEQAPVTDWLSRDASAHATTDTVEDLGRDIETGIS